MRPQFLPRAGRPLCGENMSTKTTTRQPRAKAPLAKSARRRYRIAVTLPDAFYRLAQRRGVAPEELASDMLAAAYAKAHPGAPLQ